MSRQRSIQERNRSRPCVEQLEDRWTPAVTVGPNTVTITGSNNADQIVVYDNGALFVHENGELTRVVTDYKRNVVIQARGGSDAVIYRQISRVQLPGPTRDRIIDIDLGDQNDLASVHLVSNVTSIYDVSVRGGPGNDMILASAAGRLTGGLQSLNAKINITLNGGEGNDSLDVRSFNDLRFNSSMDVRMFGGAGTDTVIHQYEGLIQGGRIDVVLDGGNGEAVFDFGIFDPGSVGFYVANGVRKL